MQYHRLSDQFVISKQIASDDVGAISDAGFKVIICNRPDDEEPGQPAADDIASACQAAGIRFHHLPFQGADLALELLDEFRDVIDGADGPVFAYCRSGQRSAYLWGKARG